ncbi:MAG: alcohol dehydrogenase catalytic domain-containing protein [Spirochaetota bacterium]
MGKLDRYKKLDYTLPASSLAWRIYGKGMEHFGNQKKPDLLDLPDPGEDEILVRSDAVGLCFSDTKIIKFGSDHPRIQGRDLKSAPVIPGHEVHLTVVKVGKNRRTEYRPGERYIIQADVVYKGTRPSYGYVLPGGLSQYGIIGKEVLDGDGGSYLIPVRNQELGYSEVALIEPWGCVVAAYRIEHRKGIKDGGTLLAVGNGGDQKPWEFTGLFSDAVPGSAVLMNLGPAAEKQVTRLLEGAGTRVIRDSGDIRSLKELHTGGKGYDDIILLGDLDDQTVESAADSLAPRGVLNYMASTGRKQTVAIDAGKIHYDVIGFIGSLGADVRAPYLEHEDYTIRGDSVLMIGAGGPMGQMHVQLAMTQPDPPSTMVVTDISEERTRTLREKFEPVARDKGIGYHILNPNGAGSPEEFRRKVLQLNGGKPFSYVVCLAAIPAVIEEAASYLADGAVLNIFAGVSKGTIVNLDIKDVAARSVRLIGSSGSSLEDMAFTLQKVERGELDTDNSVAGIAGMNDVWRGIDAVRTGSFPGKIVVYPHIRELDLVSLKELEENMPSVARHLAGSGKWTREAEAALLEEMLDID